MPAQQAFVLTSWRTGQEYNVTNIGITLDAYYHPIIFFKLHPPLVSSTRHLLTLATEGQNRIGQAPPKGSSLDSSKAVISDLTAQAAAAPIRISAEHAKVLLESPSKGVLSDEPLDLKAMLSAVAHEDGIERQLRIADYLQAIETLSPEEQAVARKQLIALFELQH
jgi:hypothetical protein